MYIIH